MDLLVPVPVPILYLSASSLPHDFAYLLRNKRLKRQAVNSFNPRVIDTLIAENPTIYDPPPYPLPTPVAPSFVQRTPRISRYADSQNPYLDALTDSYYPNYGFGVLVHRPVLISGGLNWPTGNILQPTDKFNGTLGVDRPIQLRFGTQGGPFYPWQDARFTKTIREINYANFLAQRAQLVDGGGQGAPFILSAPNPRFQSRFDFVQPQPQQSFGSALNRLDPLSLLFGPGRR